MRLKCLSQEHTTMTPARACTRTARSEGERSNHEATMRVCNSRYILALFQFHYSGLIAAL